MARVALPTSAPLAEQPVQVVKGILWQVAPQQLNRARGRAGTRIQQEMLASRRGAWYKIGGSWIDRQQTELFRLNHTADGSSDWSEQCLHRK